jgi:DNA-directed RNA polymerase specialized sigma24 family protein
MSNTEEEEIELCPHLTGEIPLKPLEVEQPTTREHLDRLYNWFPRCRSTLHYIAQVILGSSELAARAVEKSWLRALRNPPRFQREGPFRSWIFRVLIGEAVSIMNLESSGLREGKAISELQNTSRGSETKSTRGTLNRVVQSHTKSVQDCSNLLH